MADSGANIRRQTIPTLQHGADDGGSTLGRHASFASVYFGDQLVGLVENVRYRQSNGTTYRGSLGTDWNEKIRGQRLWSGTIERGAVRTSDVLQILNTLYPNVTDIDFSQLDFNLKLEYDYQSVTGITDYEQAESILHTVTITDFEVAYSGPYEIEMENCTFLAKGFERNYTYNDKTTFSIYNPKNLWGSGGAAAPPRSGSSASATTKNSDGTNLIDGTGATSNSGAPTYFRPV